MDHPGVPGIQEGFFTAIGMFFMWCVKFIPTLDKVLPKRKKYYSREDHDRFCGLTIKPIVDRLNLGDSQFLRLEQKIDRHHEEIYKILLEIKQK